MMSLVQHGSVSATGRVCTTGTIAAILYVWSTTSGHAAVEWQGLETIQVTATRRSETAFDVPNAITILTRESITASAPQTVMEALRNEPGMYVQQTTPGQGVVIVRGLKGSEILHVVDGFRLNNAIFRNAPNQYVALVDSQALERIEVVRGPMSALYGSDAMGGIVQMLTAEPRFEATQWDTVGLVRSTVATADDSNLSRIEAAIGKQDLAVSGGFTYQDVGQRRVGGGEVLPYTGFSARAADLKVRGEMASGHELTLSYQYSEQPRTPRHDELTPGYGQVDPTSATYWFDPQQRDLLHLRWKLLESTSFADSAEIHLGRQAIRDDRRVQGMGSTNLDVENNRDVSTGLTLQAGKTVAAVHYVTWGADLYADKVDSSRTRINLTSESRSERAPRFPDGSKMLQWGVYAADDWSPIERLDVLASLRLVGNRTRLPQSGDFSSVELDDTGWAGNAGLAWQAREAVRIVTNLGRAYRSPNIFDLGTFGDRPGNRYSIPNPDLSPETVTTLDAGVKWASTAWQGELMGYRSWYSDKITSVLTGETTPTGQLVVQSRNATRLDLYGVEFATRSQVSEAVELYGSVTWTHGTESVDGEDYPADRIPPLVGVAGMLWRAGPGLAFDGYAAFAGSQDFYSPRDEVDPRIKPGGTPGWVTWNLRANYEHSTGVRLLLLLSNLSDHRYREFGSGLDAPGFDCRAVVELHF